MFRLVTVLISLAAMLSATPARAALLDWTGITGNAGVAANWNPIQVPAALDDLRFGVAGAYTVTFGSQVDTTHSFRVTAGAPVFRFSTPHVHNDFFRVGDGASGDLALTLGTVSSFRGAVVGRGAGASGVLRVSGAGTDAIWKDESQSFLVGTSLGLGQFRVGDGAIVAIVPSLVVGGTGGAGVLAVDGEVSSTRRSTLVVDVADAVTRFGADGIATVTVTDGALLDVRRTLHLGSLASGNVAMTVAGAGAHDSARVLVTGDLMIGRNPGTATGGTATVTVGTGAAMEVSGSTWTYDDQGQGTTRLEVQNGARFSTRDLRVNSPTQLHLLGGITQVAGGVLDHGAHPLVLNGSPLLSLQLLAGATAALHSSATEALVVAEADDAHLAVHGGSSLLVHDAPAVLGAEAGGSGTLEIGTGGSVVVDDKLIAGLGGYGRLLMTSGGQATVGALDVAAQLQSHGAIEMQDAGTDLHVTGPAYVAGTAAGFSDSQGEVWLRSGAELWLDQPGVSGAVWFGGTMNLDPGAALRLAGDFTVEGEMVLEDAAISGGRLALTLGGLLEGWGDVNSRIAGVPGSEIEWEGPTLLGAWTADGFEFAGTLKGSDGALLTIRDADSARVGNIVLGGGTITFPPIGGAVMPAGFALTNGRGTLDGDLVCRGALQAGTLANELRLGGTLRAEDIPMTGDFHFLAGGGFVGRGHLQGSVRVDSGSTVQAIGPLTLGVAPSVSTLWVDGALRTGTDGVTFLTTDSARVRGTLVLEGGGVAVTSTTPGVVVAPGGRIEGDGVIWKPTVVAGGIAPGASAGLLQFLSLHLEPTAVLEIEVGGTQPAASDFVNSLSSMHRDGTLDVRLLPGYVPEPGDSILVLYADEYTGMFERVTYHGGSAAGVVSLHFEGRFGFLVFEAGVLDAPAEPASAPTPLAFRALGSPGRAPVLELALPAASHVTLDLFDIAGRRVAALHHGMLAAGRHRFTPPAATPAGEVCFARARIEHGNGRLMRVVRVLRLR